jgi:hypothetical protein
MRHATAQRPVTPKFVAGGARKFYGMVDQAGDSTWMTRLAMSSLVLAA